MHRGFGGLPASSTEEHHCGADAKRHGGGPDSVAWARTQGTSDGG
jgi:hypothetical protein